MRQGNGGCRAWLIHGMASLSYITIFLMTRVGHLPFRDSRREEMQHDPSIVQMRICKGVNAPPVLELQEIVSRQCWLGGRGGGNIQDILCVFNRFGTEKTGAKPHCVGDFFLIISGIG